MCVPSSTSYSYLWSGPISANFLGSSAGADEGKALFYENVQLLGSLVAGGGAGTSIIPAELVTLSGVTSGIQAQVGSLTSLRFTSNEGFNAQPLQQRNFELHLATSNGTSNFPSFGDGTPFFASAASSGPIPTCKVLQDDSTMYFMDMPTHSGVYTIEAVGTGTWTFSGDPAPEPLAVCWMSPMDLSPGKPWLAASVDWAYASPHAARGGHQDCGGLAEQRQDPPGHDEPDAALRGRAMPQVRKVVGHSLGGAVAGGERPNLKTRTYGAPWPPRAAGTYKELGDPASFLDSGAKTSAPSLNPHSYARLGSEQRAVEGGMDSSDVGGVEHMYQ